MVPWPASKKERNHLGVHLFLTVQKYEYQQAYQAQSAQFGFESRLSTLNFCSPQGRRRIHDVSY